MAAHPTTEWSSLQDVFYRKTELYALSWGIDNLADYQVAAASNGGLVALVRDPTRLVSIGKTSLLKPKVLIYTAAGQLIESLPWERADRIVALGFTLQEQLVVVLEDGHVRIYTLMSPAMPSGSKEATSNAYYTEHSLGTEATETGVADAKIWSGGLIALVGAQRLVEWKFPHMNEDGFTVTVEASSLQSWAIESGPVHSWAIVPVDGAATVLVARESTLLSLTQPSVSQDLRLDRGPFYAVCASPNGKLLALLTADLILWVVSSDFTRSLSEFEIGISEHGGGLGGSGVRQIEWCGNNTVGLAFNDEVMMVGPFGDSVRYPYSGPVCLVGEQDGLRIISSDRHEFILKVPDVSTKVFQPGSNDPAALLLEASEQYSSKSSRADEGVRAIRASLPEAVDTCLQAAAYEWNLGWQKRLLKAASFGKSFVDLHDPAPFIEMARTLRILNAARDYRVGIPITYDEYNLAGPSALLGRLTSQNHHLLSLRIANYLDIRPDSILRHWARAKIARSVPPLSGSTAAFEENLCAEIVRRFQTATSLPDESPVEGLAINFSEVAWTAWKAGRRNLATRLLDHEARAIDQVPLLLNMHEDKLALVKAVESGDTDLIYHVLLRLKTQLSRGDFFRIVQAPISDALTPGMDRLQPARQHLALASHLLEAYARETDREMLRDFYYQDDRRTDSAILALEEAIAVEKEPTEKIFRLKTAVKFFSEDKERVLEAKLVEEQIRLLAFQQALEKEDGARFVGLSLNETIRQLLLRNMAKKAEKLRSDFKVPDKRFWNLRLSTLVESKDWDGLWSFGMSKRSPVGYTPFVVQLVERNQLQEATRYVAKVQDKADRNALTAYTARLPNQTTANQILECLT